MHEVRDLIFFLSSSAGSVGTSLASQISHLNNAFLYYFAGEPFPFLITFPKQSLLPGFLSSRARPNEEKRRRKTTPGISYEVHTELAGMLHIAMARKGTRGF